MKTRSKKYPLKKHKQVWSDRFSYYAEVIDKFKIKRADMALFIFFIFASFFSAANMHLIIGSGEGAASIAVLNKGKRSILSLERDRTVDLGHGKEVCVLKISKGTVRIATSSCPKKICVNTGAIEKPGQSIICLHHKIVVEIKGESDFDASIR